MITDGFDRYGHKSLSFFDNEQYAESKRNVNRQKLPKKCLVKMPVNQ